MCDGIVNYDDIQKIFHEMRKSKFYNADYIPCACWLVPFVIVFLVLAVILLNLHQPVSAVRRWCILFCLIMLILAPVFLMVKAKRSAQMREP